MKLNIIFLRAATLAALLSVQTFSLDAFSQSKSITNKSETYKDIVEKAYNLSLQKDRQQALNILLSALQRETRPQAVAELRKAINDIAHVFISDKAQQMFESGLSLRKMDLAQALGKLNEALRIESDNMAIITELSRVMVAKGDCSGAQDLVTKQIKFLLYDDELKLTTAQVYMCQSSWADYAKIYDNDEVHKSSLQKFWLALEVERYFKTKNFIKAQEMMGNLKKLDTKYPEVSYWSWRLAQITKKVDLEDAQKYLVACKNISANQYRQYMMDPMLCRHVAEVEADLKGSNGTTE